MQSRRRFFIVTLLIVFVVAAVFLVSRVTKKHDANDLPKKTTVKPTPQDQHQANEGLTPKQ